MPHFPLPTGCPRDGPSRASTPARGHGVDRRPLECDRPTAGEDAARRPALVRFVCRSVGSQFRFGAPAASARARLCRRQDHLDRRTVCRGEPATAQRTRSGTRRGEGCPHRRPGSDSRHGGATGDRHDPDRDAPRGQSDRSRTDHQPGPARRQRHWHRKPGARRQARRPDARNRSRHFQTRDTRQSDQCRRLLVCREHEQRRPGLGHQRRGRRGCSSGGLRQGFHIDSHRPPGLASTSPETR